MTAVTTDGVRKKLLYDAFGNSVEVGTDLQLLVAHKSSDFVTGNANCLCSYNVTQPNTGPGRSRSLFSEPV
jgi:hypothetical protein